MEGKELERWLAELVRELAEAEESGRQRAEAEWDWFELEPGVPVVVLG